MKTIIFVLLILAIVPVTGKAQDYGFPEPSISILRVEVNKDTLFVYRQVTQPPHPMMAHRDNYVYSDRLVYVIRGKVIVLLKPEKAKIRRIKVEQEEEYWQ